MSNNISIGRRVRVIDLLCSIGVFEFNIGDYNYIVDVDGKDATVRVNIQTDKGLVHELKTYTTNTDKKKIHDSFTRRRSGVLLGLSTRIIFPITVKKKRQ